MKRFFKTFGKDESGAVSADWVAMTAAIMLFAVAVSASVKTAAISAGDTISNNVAGMATP